MGLRGIGSSGFIPPSRLQPSAFSGASSRPSSICSPNKADTYDPLGAAMKAQENYKEAQLNVLEGTKQPGGFPSISSLFRLREAANQVSISLALLKSHFKQQLEIINSLLDDRTKPA